jgi:hypothetical protein
VRSWHFSQSPLITDPLHSFDTSMAQKSRFKIDASGQEYKPRKAFPQLPYAHIKNAKFLQTAKGKLLVDGWWAYLRKPVRAMTRSVGLS